MGVTVRPLSAETKVLIARLGTCYYHLGFYQAWEECQRLAGKTPARDIEKSVKWNGDPDCRGKGHTFITTAVAARSKTP